MLPKPSPNMPWARNDKARPLAAPPGWNSGAGISRVVTIDEQTRKTLMVRAAVSSNFLAPAMRPVGRFSVSPGLDRICGMTATPVSNPERPKANLGKTRSAMAIIIHGLLCSAVRLSHQWSTGAGFWIRETNAVAITTTFSAR